jgi:hypothetical protein
VEFCSPACQTCDVYWRQYVASNDYDDDDDVDDDDDNENDADNNKEEEKGNDTVGALVMPKPARIGSKHVSTQFGVPQNLGGPSYVEHIVELTHRREKYMGNILLDPKYQNVFGSCLNMHTSCSIWSITGKCKDELYKSYMQYQCAPSCGSCRMVDRSKRCPPAIPSDGTTATNPSLI